MKRLLAACLMLGLTAGCAATSKVRYIPARWMVDDDKRPVKLPRERPEYSYSDALNYHILYQFERLVNFTQRSERALHFVGFPVLQEALNVNNFDEVPDSTWFTNRLSRRPMSIEELRRGPNKTTGPDPKGPWTIISAKSAGVSPGFVIKDATGETYIIKFDPPGHLDLGTAAEVIGTKIMYAAGYNVPDTYIVDFHPKILQIDPKATTRTSTGKKMPFTDSTLQEIFRKVAEKGDGYYRAVASRFIEGKPVGPFSLRGKREGDKNDRFPHEHRRELRGYKVVSSLINNADTREGNTLDTFIKTGPDDKGYLKHYIIDFSSTLGSASENPKHREHFDDYRFNIRKVGASFFSAGIYQPDWSKKEDSGLPGVGIFDAKDFRAELWRPMYPNPGFQNATDRDSFWMAKIVTRLSDADIRAIVEEGKYSDPRATDWVTEKLIERRNKIGRYWFNQVNPLDNFLLVESGGATQLKFDDLMVTRGLSPAGTVTYRYRLSQGHGAYELIDWTETTQPLAELSSEAIGRMKPGNLYLVQIQTRREGDKFFGPIVDVIVQKDGNLKIMGLNRRYRAWGSDETRHAEK